MERSKRDLEALVTSQKEQLTRYEKRLKDVVTAYKGLLKEKEALETSLTALTTNKDEPVSAVTEGEIAIDVNDGSAAANDDKSDARSESQSLASNATVAADDKNNLQSQIMTLMNSLATLSAEKSRMEASFQADKKQMRAHLTQKDQTIADLQRQQKEIEERAKDEVEQMKAKWIIERQEREKETNNQMLMIRELQKLYGDERHLKENIEMQLNNFKTQFASNEAENSRVRELQQQLKEAKAQLKQLHLHDKQAGSVAGMLGESASVLQQLRQETQQLKEQHAVAIKSEQRRVLLAEEQGRRQAALHENRVVNLESRLAELSNTVGNYDRLRQQDQQNIQALKQQLEDLKRVAQTDQDIAVDQLNSLRRRSLPKHDAMAIVDEIVRLKKLLMNANAHSEQPIDVSKIFAISADHLQCQEELNRLQQQYDAAETELAQSHERLQVQKSHVATLQEKVKVLNRNIDEQEAELKRQGEKQRQAVKVERARWKDALNELENESRCKVNDLEQQLQKQRQRSLQLLDEKEQEIKALQTSFEIIHSSSMPPMSVSNAAALHETQASISSDSESVEGANSKDALKSKKLSVGENCHMLHYANELARKDIEIAGLRKAKYAAETSLRKAIHEKVTAQEELCDKIALLEEQVDRLERCQTREGANLEYLKNVIISFIMTHDSEGKRHMLNAISAVLQFTTAEMQAINAVFHRK